MREVKPLRVTSLVYPSIPDIHKAIQGLLEASFIERAQPETLQEIALLLKKDELIILAKKRKISVGDMTVHLCSFHSFRCMYIHKNVDLNLAEPKIIKRSPGKGPKPTGIVFY